MALYRRYRPQKFQDVIGQEHVTKPLMAALRAGKTAHAYLFSGPRGCGKTTSARILARCLNCEQAPTDTPCGVCESCRELSAEGSGSLDVVEMDAASHGGVDDARDLIERASFAPARDRYKIFIIDEAHMVSNQGFNALLKLVEEPPPHIKFIFATTEPEKVIGTIRSRTHHYPFRLVPPDELESYLGKLCAEEGVEAGAGVLSLVVRAGGGSVRDSLSVLDQLIGGSEGSSLTYEAAIGLLGFTDGSLLDDSIGALAARDGATLFAVVDRVVQSGHDPRRFVEDLLQRLRDIVVIALAGESARDVLVSVPEDQYERMVEQASHLGAARASHSADLVNDALSQMVGATSPRLQLELLCARLLLPQAGTAEVPQGGAVAGASPAREDRSPASRSGERPARPSSASRPASPVSSQPANPSVPGRQIRPEWAAPGEVRGNVRDTAGREAPASGIPTERSTGTSIPSTGPKTESITEQVAQASGSRNEKERVESTRPAVAQPVTPPAEPVRAPSQSTASSQTKPAAGTTPAASGDISMVRQRWKEIVADVQTSSKSTAALIHTNAQVGGLEGGVLTLLFQTQGLATTFNNRGHAPRVQSALHDVLGIDVTVQASVGGDEPAPKAQAVEAAGNSSAAPEAEPRVAAARSSRAEISGKGTSFSEPEPRGSTAESPTSRDVPPASRSGLRDAAPDTREAAPEPSGAVQLAAEPSQPEQRTPELRDPAGVLAQLLDAPVDPSHEHVPETGTNGVAVLVPSSEPEVNLQAIEPVEESSGDVDLPPEPESELWQADSAVSSEPVAEEWHLDSEENSLDSPVEDVPFYAQQMPTPRRPEDLANATETNSIELAQPKAEESQRVQETPRRTEASRAPEEPDPHEVTGSPRTAESAPTLSDSSGREVPSFALPNRPRPGSSGAQKSTGSIGDRIRAMHATGNSGSQGAFTGQGYGGNTNNRGADISSGHTPFPEPVELYDPYDDGVSPDDPTIAQSNLVGIEVVLNTFKGTVIEEQAGNGE